MHKIISETQSAHVQARNFLLGLLQDINTNQMHFEHDQILEMISRKKKDKTFFDSEVVSLAIKHIAIYSIHVGSAVSNQIRFRFRGSSPLLAGQCYCIQYLNEKR